MKKISFFIILLIGCSHNNEQFQLNETTFKMWRDFIKPTRDEMAWSEIPWETTFYNGLIESDKEQKPLLLWVMNGHPLGCT